MASNWPYSPQSGGWPERSVPAAPASSAPAPALLKTPTTVRATRTLAAEVYLDSMMTGGECNPEQIRQLCQSTIINATLRQTAEEELKSLQASAAARAYRQKPGKKVVQKGCVLYAYNALEAVNKRLEKEAEASGKAAARKHLAAEKVAKGTQNQASSSQTSGCIS